MLNEWKSLDSAINKFELAALGIKFIEQASVFNGILPNKSICIAMKL